MHVLLSFATVYCKMSVFAASKSYFSSIKVKEKCFFLQPRHTRALKRERYESSIHVKQSTKMLLARRERHVIEKFSV